jgi:hypothetical protein
MLRKALLSQWLVVPASLAVNFQTCIWKNGDPAEGFIPVSVQQHHQAAAAAGETCLSSGLYCGNIGLVYQGACANEWGGDCITYCDEYGERQNFLKYVDIADSLHYKSI